MSESTFTSSDCPPSPIDAQPASDQLLARVILPGTRPAVFGYDVHEDLAQHYSFSDVLYLTICGELPDEPASILFELAMTVALPLSVRFAPVHAAVVARTCGARPSGVFAAGAIALVEHVAQEVSEHAALLAWLNQQDVSAPPPQFLAGATEELQIAARLQALCRARELDVPVLAHPWQGVAAAIVLLHTGGLRRPEQFESALCAARWPSVMAEGLAAPLLGFREYALRRPSYAHRARKQTPAPEAARGE